MNPLLLRTLRRPLISRNLNRKAVENSLFRYGKLPNRAASTSAAPEDIDLDVLDDDSDIQDPGIYETILPPEPYVFGTSHIVPRPVPTRIIRPSYVQKEVENGIPYPPEQYTGDGRILFGTGEEKALRAAASLAKRTVDYAGTLVKVRFSIARFEQRRRCMTTDRLFCRPESPPTILTRPYISSSSPIQHTLRLCCTRDFPNHVALA